MKTIQTSLSTLHLDTRSGDLVGLKWKRPSVELIREPRLGENFRLLLPRPGYEANYFLSREQKISRIEATPDGVTCIYDSLHNERERVPVAVRYHISVVGERLEFSIEVNNPTDRPLAEVYFAIIGGQQGLGRRQDTESLVPSFCSNAGPNMFTQFAGGSYGGGNLGIRHSAMGFLYPHVMAMSWMGLYNRRKNLGLYFGDHDPVTRLTGLYCEVRPFTSSALTGDNWPQPSQLPPDEPIGLNMGWMKFPYTRRGVFCSSPVALQIHRGDWREGGRLYRAWFDRHFPVKRPASWLRREHAWQSIIISNPEDVIVHRFKDLPKLAAGAKKHGVTTFEILGWDKGGIDRGYPQYTPEPRLGTHAEFRKALQQIRKMGVHPLIFTNIQVADVATPLFKKELRQYAVHGRWSEDLNLWGWGEGTISSRFGLSKSTMTLISPSHPAVRKRLLRDMLQLVRDGASGFQLDKACLLAYLDFNPRLPCPPDQSLSNGVLETLREIVAKARRIDPQFALASEIHWDRAYSVIDVVYLRMGSIDMDHPVFRYTFPECTATIFAENPGDINVMNNGMRYGYVWALAPRHYNDSLDEPLTRPLARYVKELIRIRKRHESVLWFGRFLDTDGAQVKGGKNMRHSVFESGNHKAVVVVNFGDSPATASVTWPGGKGTRVEMCQPFQKNRTAKLPVQMTLPPRTCSVVVTT